MPSAAGLAAVTLLGLVVGASMLPVVRGFHPALPRASAAAAIVLTGALFGLSTWRFGLTWQLVAYLYFAAVSVALAVIDVHTKRLPDILTLPSWAVMAALLIIPAAIDDGWSAYVRALVSGAILLAVFLGLHLVYPAGMGFGDVKLAFPMGVALGWLSWRAPFWGMCLGFLLGAAVSLVLLISRRATRHSEIPFGPFMLAGAWIVILAASGA